MADMRVVNRDWTGSCVIACDCGSEEPVEGTAFSGELELMGDEIKKLRSRNRDLEEQCLEFRRLSSLTSNEVRDEWHDLVTLTMDLSKENKMLKNPPLDTWRQETDKNISELKRVTEYLSAIHRKELNMIEAHEAIHRIHAEEIRRKQEANSEGESSE